MFGVELRFGAAADVPLAREVERSADSRFGAGLLPGDEVTDAEAFAAARFVIAERGGRMVGFALAAEYGDSMHLEQLAVLPDEGRQGIGSALLEAVIDDARALGCDAVTLTTFRSVPWNAPFYRRRGFAEPATLPAHLVGILVDESRLGFEPRDRVGMVLPLA